jgi:hypothetical protein
MELIVKIGADQQGLNDTITRMKEQFKTMNVSMPAAWGGTPGRGAIVMSQEHRAVLAQNARLQEDSFGSRSLNAVAQRGVSLLKANLWMGLTELLSKITGDAIWEKIYGVDDKTTARIAGAHKKILATVTALRAAQMSYEENVHESVIKHASPEARLKILKTDKEQADSDVLAKQRAFDEAREKYDDVKSGRTRKAITGEVLTNLERRPFTIAMADAETKLIEARQKQLAMTDRYRDELDANVRADVEQSKEAKSGKFTADEGDTSSPIKFQADAMAQAGLFQGSAVLANPNLGGEQLAELKIISSKLDRPNPWTQ